MATVIDISIISQNNMDTPGLSTQKPQCLQASSFRFAAGVRRFAYYFASGNRGCVWHARRREPFTGHCKSSKARWGALNPASLLADQKPTVTKFPNGAN